MLHDITPSEIHTPDRLDCGAGRRQQRDGDISLRSRPSDSEGRADLEAREVGVGVGGRHGCNGGSHAGQKETKEGKGQHCVDVADDRAPK